MSRLEHDDRNQRLFNAIEVALGRLHRRKPMDDVMKDLHFRYDSAMYLMESSAHALSEAGLAPGDALLLSAIPALARRCLQDEYGEKPRLNTVSVMAQYLQGFFVGVHVEHFYMVCLDRGGRLIETVLLQKGGDDSTPFYLEQMLSIAVRKGAFAIVLCHNHPRGTMRSSDADIHCTLQAMNALLSTGIVLLNHIIIAGKQPVSMRECGMVKGYLWLHQNMESTLNRNWLDQDLLP